MTTDSELKSVVWEWMNDRCKWSSYSSDVCHLLERAHERGLNLVCLGDVDARLKSYTVNLREFQQVSEVTGFRRAVRRKLFSNDSIAALGISWQWGGDRQNEWFIFDMDVATAIENAYKQGLSYICLNKISRGYCYNIDFDTMTQTSNRSGFIRPIRRVDTSPYPLLRHPTKKAVIANAVDSNHMQPSTSNESSDNKQKNNAVNLKSSSPKKGIIKQFTSFANKIIKLASNESNEQQLISDGDTEKSLSEKSMDTSSNSISLEVKPLCDEKNQDNRKETRTRKKSKCQSKGTTEKSLKGHSKDSTKAFYSSYYAGQVKPVPGVKPPKTTRSNSVTEDVSTVQIDGNEVVFQFCTYIQEPSTLKEDCIICCEALSIPSPYNDDSCVISLNSCHHLFHRACITAMYNSGTKDGHLQCPTCKMIYGIKRGNQPRGTMDFHVIPRSLPGYPECETICVIYNIPPGVQGPEHLHPGRKYTSRGFPRVCYLPNNEKGRKVLRLLVKAWERRLLFTVGSSATTGEEDTVTWNEIHHKTEFNSNYSGHGWPDPHYLDNVLMELAIQGVVE